METPGNNDEVILFLRKECAEIKDSTKYPLPISSLEKIYSDFIDKEFENMFLRCPQLKVIGKQNVMMILQHYVINEAKSKNYFALFELIKLAQEKFLKNIDFFQKGDEKFAVDFIDNNIALNDEIILLLFESDKKSNKNKVEMLDLNAKMQTIYIILLNYQQMLYFKYEMHDFYYSRISEIKSVLMSEIYKACENIYPKPMTSIKEIINKAYKTTHEEFKTQFESNVHNFFDKEPKINNLVDMYKSAVTFIIGTYKERVSESIKAEPTEILVLENSDKLKQHIKNFIIDEWLRSSLSQDYALFNNTIHDEAEGFMRTYYQDKKLVPLDPDVLGETMGPLFVIILATDYLESNLNRYDIYYKVIENFYITYCLDAAQVYPEIYKAWGLVQSFNKCKGNRCEIEAMLEAAKKKWKEMIKLSINLYTMVSLFIIFTDILSEKSKIYDANTRYLLKSIFRNLNWGNYRFTNFQILCLLEKLHVKYTTEKFDMDVESAEFTAFKVLGKIRNTSIEKFDEHDKYLDQIKHICSDLPPKLAKPKKFFFEKISSIKNFSRHIIITIAGYTSEDYSKKEIFQGVINSYPNSEIFSLNWSSSREVHILKSIFENAVKFTGQNKATKAMLGLVLAESALLSFVGVTMTTVTTVQALKEQLWGEVYEEAIRTGIYLAHVLAETDLFKNHSVSLVGFSLGTVVIMHCIWELEKIGRFDVIYDVLLLGGAADIGDFNQKSLNVVANNIVNVYSSNDNILKYLLKVADWSCQPAGLSPLISTDQKVKNLDASEKVDGHMDYKEKLISILKKVDFNEDIDFILKDI